MGLTLYFAASPFYAFLLSGTLRSEVHSPHPRTC